MPEIYGRTYTDRSGERSSVTVNLRTDFADDTARDTALTALGNAMDGVSRGNPVREKYEDYTLLGQGSASDPQAHREFKLVVQFYDTVTFRRYSLEIPCASDTALTYVGPNSDEVVLTDSGVMAALVTALENDVRSIAGNTISVTGAYTTGRSI